MSPSPTDNEGPDGDREGTVSRREPSFLGAVEEELQRHAESLHAVSGRISEIEQRLRALEERGPVRVGREDQPQPTRPQIDPATQEGRKRLERLVHHLQDSIDQIAEDGAGLRRQVQGIVSVLEDRRDAGALSGLPETDAAGGEGLAQRAIRELVRQAKRVLRPGYRAGRSLAGRARRAVLRRLPPRWTGGFGAGDEVRLSAGRPRPVPSPALSVVIPVDELGRDGLGRLKDALQGQTATSVEWVLWSARDGTVEVCSAAWETLSKVRAADGTALRGHLRGVCATTVTPASAALPPVWFELATWAVVAENLPLARLVIQDSEGWRACHPDPSIGGVGVPVDLLVVRRDLWSPAGLHVEAFCRLAARTPRLLGRLIHHVGDYEGRPGQTGALLPDEAAEVVRLYRDYLVAARQPPSVFHHTIYPIDEALIEEPVDDPRRTVLVLLPFLAIGGAEKLTYDLMRQIEDRFRFVVVTLAPHDAVLGNRLEDFRRLTPYVYTLGDSSNHALLFSAISHLVRKYRVSTLFNANGTTWFYDALPDLRRRFPEVTIVNQLFDHREGWIEYYGPDVVTDCDVHLATNRVIEATLLREHDVPATKIRQIPHGIDLGDFRPATYTAERRAALRADLGVPQHAVLVTMAVRMHPQKRPEDFVVLAHSMQDEANLFFLLVGGGPLDGTVDDLIDFYGLDNLRRLGFYSPIADLLAITDVACMMSEYEALPLYVLSALAMEVPVVSTAVGAIESVLRQGPCGIVVPKVGDLPAFREALQRLGDPERRRELGRAGRRLVEERFGIAQAAEAYAGVFEEGDGRGRGPGVDT